MKKKFILLFSLCLTTICQASVHHVQHDSTMINSIMENRAILHPLTPTYHKNISDAANWGYNWFIEVKGGASAFLGSPLGCGDLFDRLKPTMQVGVGKWFTPAVGGRVEYQGFKFKSAEFKNMNYHFVHADFLYNLTAFLNQNDKGLSKWDVIPYLGVGMIYNPDWTSSCMCIGMASGSHPFAFSYGLESRYHLNDRLHIIAEISGMTTSKKFDAIGPSTKFGDHMITLSAGLSVTIGKNGWKKVIDAKPYMEQNNRLLNYMTNLDNHSDVSENIVAGKEPPTLRNYPRNNYSGLNSLRARLGYGTNEDDKDSCLGGTEPDNKFGVGNAISDNSYISAILNGKVPVGSPIFFFFNIGTNILTDQSQIVNIDEIANVAKAHNLRVKVIGAADSATGNEKGNELLSKQRADYICKLLSDRGVASERITIKYEGGIDEYSPVQANRNTCVMLSF